jgi:hypothetical protein
MTPRWIRLTFWMLAIGLGGSQTWYTRHRIFSDGISYLEIAQQYAKGDWHAALNAYWSPLYSWLIAAYLAVFHPAAYWEVSAMHVINFAAFLSSVWVFERFLLELIEFRNPSTAGLSKKSLTIIGYVAILHGGLLMVGIGYVSPDLIAYFLTGCLALLTLRIASHSAAAVYFACLGLALGLAYLDRAAFAPLSLLYLLAAMALVLKKPSVLLTCTILCGTCFTLVAVPFIWQLSAKQQVLTLGESGRLNYGWEVDGASRSEHWQGEPGDIGRPRHSTRAILQNPVPVYEFGDPVSGSYPPWYDPSYWYDGIQPHLKLASQLKVLSVNLRTTLIYLATTPAFVIVMLLFLAGKGRGFRLRELPTLFWSLTVPAAAGIGLYCVVFIDKRYIAGFFLVLLLPLLVWIELPKIRWATHLNAASQALAVLFLLALIIWLRPALTTSLLDAVMGHESESNVSWEMAEKFAGLGLKQGDKIAFVGSGISADWVRIAGAHTVAEVPVKWIRRSTLLNVVEPDETNSIRFFQLDEKSREKVYDAFRAAGAILAVTSRIPAGGSARDWKPLLDPNEPRYPKSGGQVLEQSPGYYRWLRQ